MPGNGYQPALTGSWVGPRAVLRLRLPSPPKSEGERTRALAAYYASMPTPFGQGVPTLSPENGGGVGDGSGAGGGGMGHWEDALVLGATVARALALSWSDEQFHDQFKGRGALLALQNWLGYTLPWNMELVTEYVSPRVAHWDPAQQQWMHRDPKGKEWSPGVSPNHLTLWVPNAPDAKYPQAVALAAYNQTGDAYPLTCP
jgi:ribosomally synthesized peptide (two-chain TOMM family)